MTTIAPEPTGPLAARLQGLGTAARAGEGHLPGDLLEPAERLGERAGRRLELSAEHTIVALAGATGSGKSSLFNALTDLELAGTGVRRPTTSWALACAWGPAGAEELLDWMGIPPRHQVSRLGMLDRSASDTSLDGLILLDLPDHDSTEVSHHVEMERLVEHSDLLVWVLDPQKYADAAIHERYIRPLAPYAQNMVVVLNQIDRIAFDHRANAVEDLRKIMASAGLSDVPVLATSATRGDGVDDLKRLLAARIREKAAARERLGREVAEVANRLAEEAGSSEPPGISDADRWALQQSLLDAAGVDAVSESVANTIRRGAARHTGWLPVVWLRSLRKDAIGDGQLSRTQLKDAGAPSGVHVQAASAESAVRDLADKAAVGLGRPWMRAVRAASTAHGDAIVADLDRAVGEADVDSARTPVWWRVARVLQWLALLALVGGLVWGIVTLFAGGDVPGAAGLALPWWLAIGGLAAGVLIAVFGGLVARLQARAAARTCERRLGEAVAGVAQARVLEPVEAVLADHRTYREGLLTALN